MTPFINIERRQYTLRIQEAGPRVCFEDKRVSEWSRYVDSVWILSQRFTVHWSRLPENYKNIDLGAFSSLMNSTKGVTYLLLVEEEQRPATVYHIVQNIKRFVCWMLSQTIPIMRFSDVTPTMITKYFEQLRNRSKTRVTRRDRNGSQQVRAATIRYHVRALLRIYYYRDRIGDGLKAWEPLFEATMLRDDENYESKTDPIPDDEFQTLLSAAVNFVNQNAVGAIQGLREFVAKE